MRAYSSSQSYLPDMSLGLKASGPALHRPCLTHGLASCSRRRGEPDRGAPAPVAKRSISMPDEVRRQAAQAARIVDAGGAVAMAVDEGLPLASPYAGSGGGGGKSASGSSSDVRPAVSTLCYIAWDSLAQSQLLLGALWYQG